MSEANIPSYTMLDNDSSTPSVPVPPSGGDNGGSGGICPEWETMQHVIFQAANFLLLTAFLAPAHGLSAMLFLHVCLTIAFILLTFWGWFYICGPDVFAWNLGYTLLNSANAIYLFYRIRPVKLTQEQKDVYKNVFLPLKVPRHSFKELCKIGRAVSLTIGENYAVEGKSPCNRLSLLVMGKVKVFCEGEFLHHILEYQFLDSPEWESYRNENNESDVFQVTLTATTYCRYLTWNRTQLQKLLASDQYLATVFTNIIGKDITKKLYLLTERNITRHGSRPDIRLPSAGKEPPTNLDLKGHLASGQRSACGVGLPVFGTSHSPVRDDEGV
ncbi:popeye domain-containing protein 2-like isoform X2 [Ptychodera flava]|uniref:popeye domain-containing protein 2-like isoform X2 n=1 Tax=Ptychodera flava TaxID=63121 RepID=UPI003969E5B4